VQGDSGITEVLYRDTPEGSEKRLAFLLRSVSAMLAVVYLLEALYSLWRGDTSKFLFRFALGNAIFFAVLRVALATASFPTSWSQPLAGVATLLSTIYAITGLKTSQEPWGTTQLLIVVLMAGFVFTSRGWFTALVIVACSGWFWAAFHHLSKDAWVQLGMALLLTVIWSMWFLETRLRSLGAFEKKAAQREHQRVMEETQIFTKPSASNEAWCPICKASPDAVIRHNGEKILDANGSATQLLGLSRSELMEMAPINLFALEFRVDKKFLSFENFQWVEKVALKKDKTRVPVDVINGRLGASGVMEMVLRDASERVRARERSVAASDRSQIFVKRQAELAQLAKLRDLPANRQTILNDVVGAAHRALPCTIGAFIVVQDSAVRVEAGSAAGKLDIEGLQIALFTWLANKNESLIVSKITDDSLGVRHLYPSAKIEAFVATPIFKPNGLAGFLMILENVPKEFTATDIDFLTTLAHRAGAILRA
jgi:PAS domain-containing protein